MLNRLLFIRFTGITVIMALLSAAAHDATGQELTKEIAARYESMLLRSPVEGTAFDKIIQYYQTEEGLEVLEQRWRSQSEVAGEQRTAYLQLLALLAEQRNRLEEAEAYFRRAAQQDTENFQPWFSLGNLQLRVGKVDDAVKSFETALALNPGERHKADILRRLGYAHQRNLDSDGALRVWQQMAADFPEDSFALQEAGDALLAVEQFDEARKIYDRLVELSPAGTSEQIQAMIRVGTLEERRGKREVALQQYEQLLDLTRSGSWLNREIRSRIEQVYRAQDDVPGLVVYYNQWMEAHPKDIEAILRLSDALNEISRFKESVEWLEQAVSMAPDRVDIAYALAKALEKTDQYDRAVLVARNLTVKQPNDTRYWELLAELLLKRNLPVSEQDRQQALAALSEIAPEGSRDVSRILQLAEMLYARDFGEEAVVQFSRALALSPAASDIRLRQAEILMALEQQDQAYTLLEGLVAGDQAQPENYQRLASVWTRYGENERAYQAIAAGLEINAEYFDLLWLKWNLLTEEQRWSEALDLYPSLQKAVSSEYLLEQLEMRYLQVLHASEQSDQVWRNLNQRVADAGASGLSVPEFRVLLRMALQKQSALEEESFDALMKQAIEAHPESESLLRMALAQQRRDMRYDEAVATAYQLAKVNPKLKTDWLAQIARIRMQQGELEQALGEARKVIELSPAATEGYLLFANLAVEGGQWEQAEERLRQAIRLSDQPNQVRVKLGGMLQDAGELKKAQNVFNDAFTAADSARERLNLMRPLSEVYFQMGQIEELIRKMEQRQQAEGEGGGWRYGLYLAEIYQQLQDYGSARDQLAKSLSQRPDDIQLIQQLIALAERERNVREVIFYREKLLEHDPAVDHAIVLAQDYLSLSQQEDAWLLIQRFKKEFLQDPMAWEEVLGQLDEGKYKEPVRGLLQESMRVRPNALETELALAKYHVRRANYQVAEEALWNIYLRPVPAETEAEKKKRESEAAKAKANINSGYAYHGMQQQNSLVMRMQNGFRFMNEFQMLLRQQNSRYSSYSRYARQIGYLPAVANVSNAQLTQDKALVFLAMVSVQLKKEDAFLERLEAELNQPGYTREQRVMGYVLSQARELLWEELVQSAEEEIKNTELLGLLQNSLNYYSQPGRTAEERIARSGEIRGKLQEQLAKYDPQTARFMKFQEALGQLRQPDLSDEEKFKQVEALKRLARKDVLHEQQAMLWGFIHVKLWDEAEQVVKRLYTDKQLQANLQHRSSRWSLLNLPVTIMQQLQNPSQEQAEKSHSQVVSLALKTLEHFYPEQKPRSSMTGYYGHSGGGRTLYQMVQSGQQFPTPNRFFGQMELQMLTQLNSTLAVPGVRDLVVQGLEQQEQARVGWRKMHPKLIRCYIKWWAGEKKPAISLMQEIVKDQPEDDLRLTLAAMLQQNKEHAAAIQVLEQVQSRYGNIYILSQFRLLDAAEKAKNEEVSQRVALRMASARLSYDLRRHLVASLKRLKLNEAAGKLEQQMTASRSQNRNQSESDRLRNLLNQYAKQKEKDKELSIARQILSRSPDPRQRNQSYARDQAIRTLDKYDQLDQVAAEKEKELQSNPDSIALNYTLASLNAKRKTRKSTRVKYQFPIWLKLERKQKQFLSYYSMDGKDWVRISGSSGDMLPMPETVYAGLVAIGNPSAGEEPLAFESFQFSPAVTDSEPESADNGSVNDGNEPAVSGSRGFETGSAAEFPAAAAWKSADIGKFNQPGELEDHGGRLHIISEGGNLSSKKDRCHFAYQEITGDGTWVVKLSGLTTRSMAEVEAGLMIRTSLEPSAKTIALLHKADRGVYLQRRTKANHGYSNRTAGAVFQAPVWLQLERAGDRLIASCSMDGEEWMELSNQPSPVRDSGTMRIGFYAATGSSKGDFRAELDQIEVTGTDPSVEWQVQESGKIAAPARLETAADGSVVIHGPLSGGNDAEALFYRTLPGDGRIRARMIRPEKKGSFRAGVMIAAAAEEAYPGMGLFYHQSGEHLTVDVTNDARQRALAYYRKTMELSPGNYSFISEMLEILNNAGFYELSKESIRQAFQATSNVEDLIQNLSSRMVETYQESDSIDELADLLSELPVLERKPSFMHGQRSNLGNLLLNMATRLLDRKMSEAGVRILYQALEMANAHERVHISITLTDHLIRVGREEEAVKILLDSLEPPDLKGESRSAIGFQQVVFHQPIHMHIRHHSGGSISTMLMAVVKKARYLGVQEELLARLSKRSESDHSMKSALEQARALLAVYDRDESFKDFVTESLKHNDYQRMINVLLVANELTAWPEQHDYAIELARQLVEKNSVPNHNLYQQSRALQQQLVSLADITSAGEQVVSIIDNQQQSIIDNLSLNRHESFERVRNCYLQMVQCGLFEQAGEFLASVLLNQYYSNNSSYKKLLDQMGERSAFLMSGQGRPYVVMEVVSEPADRTTLVWEVIPSPLKEGGKTNLYSSDHLALWGVHSDVFLGDYELQIWHGLHDSQMQQVNVIPEVRVTGSLELQAALKAGLVQARLVNKEDQAVVAVSPLTFVAAGKNLVANSSLQSGEGDAVKIPHWSGLGTHDVIQLPEHSVPLPGVSGIRISGSGHFSGGLYSEGKRVPIAENQLYLLSCWNRHLVQHGSSRIGVRFLDREGRKIRETWLNNGSRNQGGWVKNQRFFKSGQVNDFSGSSSSIPGNATEMQVIMKISGVMELADLKLMTVPLVKEKDPAVVAK